MKTSDEIVAQHGPRNVGLLGPLGPRTTTLHTVVSDVLSVSRMGVATNPDWGHMEVGVKLMEEVGELAEAVLVVSGKMKHKTLDMEDPVFEESADTILVVLDLLGKMYGKTMTDEEILARLQKYIAVKTQKWERILRETALAEKTKDAQLDLFADTPKDYNVHILGKIIRVDTEQQAWDVIGNMPFGAVFQVHAANGDLRDEFIPF